MIKLGLVGNSPTIRIMAALAVCPQPTFMGIAMTVQALTVLESGVPVEPGLVGNRGICNEHMAFFAGHGCVLSGKDKFRTVMIEFACRFPTIQIVTVDTGGGKLSPVFINMTGCALFIQAEEGLREILF